MMHIGLVGAGNVSDTHARAASAIPGVTIEAVYSRSQDRGEVLATRHGARAYTDLDRFLDHRPMDLVAIGTPSGLHATHGIAAARRGLHVLVEKPIDISTVRADALIAAASDHHVKLGVFFQERFAPGVRRLKTLMDEGRLGRPILASARVKWFRPREYYAGSSWRGTWALDGGGALMNQGVHTIDLLLWMLGGVRRVSGRTATALHAIEVEDTAAAVLEFDNGALATLEASTSVFPGYARRLEISGTEGTAILEGDRLAVLDLRAPRAEDRPDPPDAGARATPRATSATVADASCHQAVLEDFIDAVARDRPPCCDGAQARRSVALVEAIYASSRRGAPVVQPVAT